MARIVCRVRLTRDELEWVNTQGGLTWWVRSRLADERVLPAQALLDARSSCGLCQSNHFAPQAHSCDCGCHVGA